MTFKYWAMSDLTGKVTVFIAGGSTGLGKELALALARRGSHVTIFARRQQQLDETREEVLSARKSDSQEIRTQSLDLTDPSKIQSAFTAQPRLPDILYCVAGGTTNELGFLVDIEPADVQRCMTNNYLTSAYPAQAMLKLWIEDDKRSKPVTRQKNSSRRRQLVFVSSAAALVAFPGYVAYTPAKCAVRALADTLRCELKRYSGPMTRYSVHISFPSNFISPSFMDEIKNKPELTKQLEGTTAPMSELMQKLHSSKQVASYIVKKVDKGDFVICSEYEAKLLFAGMAGTSPKRGIGFIDSCVSTVSVAAGPILRRWLDAKVVKDSITSR
ncbi:short chain dehydrogenase reductase family [Fusarium avenaceum]|nr:short chain dehydrogenase reductase family [Fusarium avenaceum]